MESASFRHLLHCRLHAISSNKLYTLVPQHLVVAAVALTCSIAHLHSLSRFLREIEAGRDTEP